MLCGRLTRDTEIRYAGSKNTAVARFTLAVDRRFKQEGQPTADFINCVAFGKTAEFLEKYGHKGVKLIVEGRIQTGSFKNKDGQTVYTTDVMVESVEFAESKATAETNTGYAPKAQPKQKKLDNTGGFYPIDESVQDEDLPF